MSREQQNPEENTKSSVFDKVMMVFTVFEILILGIGVILSLSGTISIMKFGIKYGGFLVFALLGLFFIWALYKIMKKRPLRSFLLGILLIMVYLFIAGLAFMNCLLIRERQVHKAVYAGSKVVVTIDDSEYLWDGECMRYRKDDLEPATQEFFDHHTMIVWKDTKDLKSAHQVYFDPNSDDRVYFMIYGGATGEWLVLDRVEH